jgi:hypothetical protein
MEPDLPEDDFLASGNVNIVSVPRKEAAVYLQKILKSKEYDPENIFNQFYLCFLHFFKSQAFEIKEYLISLLRNLRDIYAVPIISRKIIQAFEVASKQVPGMIDLASARLFFGERWKEVESEALDLFVKIFEIELHPQE